MIKTPREAPTPVPTITAVGVARPRAHGHDTTTTAMASLRQKAPVDDSASSSAGRYPMPSMMTNHAKKVNTLNAITTGTNTAAMRSA